MASHIGKLPIAIPAGVEVKIEGQNFSAKGAKGSDSYVVPEGITAAVEGNEIVLTAADDLRPTRAKHGLARSIMAGTPTTWLSKAPTSRSWARLPPTSASCALRNPTRARASSIPMNASCARLERLVSDMSVAILGKGKKVALKRRHARIRKRISGTPERPRLVVTRSNRHMVAQVVDDTKGITLVSASTLQADFAGFEGTKTEAAKKVGELIAEKAKAAGITAVVADGAREGGLAL